MAIKRTRDAIKFMERIRTSLYKKQHRSGRTNWVVEWLNPETQSWNYSELESLKLKQLVEARVREALFRGENPFPKNSTIKEINVSDLIDIFYQSPCFMNASPRWQTMIQSQFEKVIRPELGMKNFASLRKEEVYKIYLNLKVKGLSHSTILKYHRKLSILGQTYCDLFPGRVNPMEQIRDFNRIFPKEAPTRRLFCLPLTN